MRERVLIVPLCLILCAILDMGCATYTTPKVAGTVGEVGFQNLAVDSSFVLVLPPLITFESAFNEEALPATPEYGSDRALDVMNTAVPDGLTNSGFRVVLPGGLDGTSAPSPETVDLLVRETRTLISKWKDKSELIPSLQQLGEQTSIRLACIQDVRVKVGSGSTYNMNSGAMTQGTSITTIAVAILSLTDGEVMWKNESVVRNTPKSGQFADAVHLLFAK